MINILSYQQPLSGSIIKEWIVYHVNNQTEYSKMAEKMTRYLNIKDDKLYRISLRSPTTACGECKQHDPDVISCNE